MSMFTALIVGTAHGVAEKVRDFGAALARAVPDLLALAGAALVAYGSGLIYHPAGFIVGGLQLLALGLLAARKAAA